uniref:Putative secreted protein n=1 Tax=Ixodes ricinus TaxID=34613 RepID=A0A147BPW3_IXORI
MVLLDVPLPLLFPLDLLLMLSNTGFPLVPDVGPLPVETVESLLQPILFGEVHRALGFGVLVKLISLLHSVVEDPIVQLLLVPGLVEDLLLPAQHLLLLLEHLQADVEDAQLRLVHLVLQSLQSTGALQPGLLAQQLKYLAVLQLPGPLLGPEQLEPLLADKHLQLLQARQGVHLKRRPPKLLLVLQHAIPLPSHEIHSPPVVLLVEVLGGLVGRLPPRLPVLRRPPGIPAHPGSQPGVLGPAPRDRPPLCSQLPQLQERPQLEVVDLGQGDGHVGHHLVLQGIHRGQLQHRLGAGAQGQHLQEVAIGTVQRPLQAAQTELLHVLLVVRQVVLLPKQQREQQTLSRHFQRCPQVLLHLPTDNFLRGRIQQELPIPVPQVEEAQDAPRTLGTRVRQRERALERRTDQRQLPVDVAECVCREERRPRAAVAVAGVALALDVGDGELGLDAVVGDAEARRAGHGHEVRVEEVLADRHPALEAVLPLAHPSSMGR